MNVINILASIGYGIANGMIITFTGYAKSHGEDWDWAKAIQTVIVGGFVGGVAGYYGMTFTTAQDWLESIGAITLFEYIKKAIWKRIKPSILKK